MGTQLQCAQCHVHPVYKEWGQRDFWGIAAYFAHTRADRPGGGKKGNGPATITDVGSPVGGGKDGAKKGKAIAANLPGTVKIPDPTEPKRIVGTARAKVFGGKEAGTLPKDAYRGALADWFTSPENSYFARAHVNRMWAYFFATGFVNPIDDLRPDNPVSHPELFKELAHEFEASGFDVKHLMRCVCNSKAYQRTSRKMPGSEDGPFSRMPVRVLTPHQLFDSLATATGREVTGVSPAGKAKGKKDGPKPTGDEAVIQAFDTRDYDENPAEYTYGIPQLLRLMNRQLTAACDDMGKQLASRSEEEAIETLYLRALSRRPTPREMIRMREFIVAAGNRTRGYSGVFWALLNSAEFICNR